MKSLGSKNFLILFIFIVLWALQANGAHDRPGKPYILAKTSFAKDFTIAKNATAFPVGVNVLVIFFSAQHAPVSS